jgi:hypothetical protein
MIIGTGQLISTVALLHPYTLNPKKGKGKAIPVTSRGAP